MAQVAIASSTGPMAVGELEITRRMSPVAVCCSRASDRSRLRASSSVSNRAFSTAMTAWSAKVCSSPISVGENPPARARVMAMTPRASPPRSIGTATTDGSRAHSRPGRAGAPGGVRHDISNVLHGPSQHCSPRRHIFGWSPWHPEARHKDSVLPGKPPRAAARLVSSPSYRNTAADHAPNSRMALSAIASKTGWTSVCAWLITRRISAVAVCRSSDSVRSRLRASNSSNSRTFSMAMTA